MMNQSVLKDDCEHEELAYREARAEMDRRLRGNPRQLAAFSRAVDLARGFVFAREGSLYFLEEVVGKMRSSADRLAGWLVAHSRLNVARDIYYLSLEEVEAAVRGSNGHEINTIAERRRIAWEGMREAWDERQPVERRGKERRGKDSIRGTAVSHGVAVGAVRIVLGATDFPKLTAGDILVCPSTTPAWTPLFTIAGAVVADVGGVLSHAAIVAREYGIPAVMGCSDATRTLVDGEQVEVNGTTGTVRRLAPRQAAPSKHDSGDERAEAGGQRGNGDRP
jgi:pyruvate,water dikinase